jgi:single-strand DNA-binding protein
MNKIFIIGNLTREPELRSTSAGIPVCTFTVAVNRRQTAEAGKPDADFFRVTTWRQLAENCNRFLAKGRKVGVIGVLNLNQYKDSNGLPRYSMEVQADEVEFLSPRSEQGAAPGCYDQPAYQQSDQRAGFEEVEPGDDLPF